MPTFTTSLITLTLEARPPVGVVEFPVNGTPLSVTCNGTPMDFTASPGFVVLPVATASGDLIRITVEMEVGVTKTD